MLESTYKFYLSFENTVCPDYVTEKLFKILAHDVVPVVYGGADYTQQAPPISYIDARKFKPKDLAGFKKKTGRRRRPLQRVFLVEGSLQCGVQH
jgi:alpha-1,3-fucosyltransferase